MNARTVATTNVAASEVRRPALPSLTGLRFLAALAVFAFHSTLSASPIPPNDPINPFADRGVASTLESIASKGGYIGVSFFFVLSGFVLAWSYRPGEPHLAFWRRRLVKVFPNHLVMWALAMALFAATITSPLGYLSGLLLLNSYVPDATVYVAVNPPSWTLCSELLFYLLFPFLFGAVLRIPVHRLWWWLTVVVACAVGVALVTQFLVPSAPKSPITPVSTLQFWAGYIFPVSRLFEFVLGSMLARLVAHGFRMPGRPWMAFLLCAAAYVASMHVPFVYSFVVVTLVPVAVLITIAAGRDAEGQVGWLGGRVMRWLGDVSFGFYICQGVTIFYVRRLMDSATFSTPVAVLVVVGLFAVTLLGGWFLHARVEMPAMRRFARRRPAVAVAAPAVRPVTEDVPASAVSR